MPITDPPEIWRLSKRRNLSDFTEELLSGTAGVTAVEYVVIICFTAAMAIISWGYLGGNLQTLFTNIACYVTGSSDCSSGDDDGEVAAAVAESDESDDDDDDSDNSGDDEDDSDEDEGGGDDDEED